MNQKDIITCMSSPLFRSCSRQKADSLLSDRAITVRATGKGQYLLHRSSDEHTLGILLKGTVIVERTVKGGRMVMSRLHPGDLFGAVSLFSPKTDYVVDIRCLSECRAILVSEDLLFEWLQRDEIILKNYLSYLNGRIRFLNQRLDALTNPSATMRLLSYLADGAENGTITVHSFTELSEILCISRPSLYRAFDKLCREGKLLREGKKIIILEEK